MCTVQDNMHSEIVFCLEVQPAVTSNGLLRGGRKHARVVADYRRVSAPLPSGHLYHVPVQWSEVNEPSPNEHLSCSWALQSCYAVLHDAIWVLVFVFGGGRWINNKNVITKHFMNIKHRNLNNGNARLYSWNADVFSIRSADTSMGNVWPKVV